MFEPAARPHHFQQADRAAAERSGGQRFRFDDLCVYGAVGKGLAQDLGDPVEIVEGSQFRKAEESGYQVDLRYFSKTCKTAKGT
jgi:hypothetical protein